MRTRNIVILLAMIVLSTGLWGCSGRRHQPQVTQPVALPEPALEESKIIENTVIPDRWWESFDDPELDRLLAQALSKNFSLKSAWARFDQAYALTETTRAAQRPQVSLEAAATRSRSQAVSLTDIIYGNQFSLYLTTSYEVDLWSGLDSLEQASRREAEASRHDLETAAMTLASQVASLWYSIHEQQAQLELLNEQLEVAETYLGLVELRFSQGLASALDVYQQRQQVVATRAKIPLAEARLKVQQHQLAILLAQPPNAVPWSARSILPGIEPIPADGLLAQLLERRPDIKAAYKRVEAADYRVAATASDRLAALRLTGRAGYAGSEAGDLFDLWSGSMSATLQHTVADGGRRDAELERTRAVTRLQLNQYGQILLTAMQEVESALVQEARQREYLEELDEQLELARSTLDEARARYVNGLSDYLPVLVALQSLHQLERTHLTARSQLIAYRIQLYRSLGGSWMASLEQAEEDAL